MGRLREEDEDLARIGVEMAMSSLLFLPFVVGLLVLYCVGLSVENFKQGEWIAGALQVGLSFVGFYLARGYARLHERLSRNDVR